MYARIAHMSGIAVSLTLLVALSVVPTSRADTALTYFLCIDPGPRCPGGFPADYR